MSSSSTNFRSRSNSGGRTPRAAMGTPGKTRSASGGRKPVNRQHGEFVADFNITDDDSVEANKIKVFVRIRPCQSANRDSVRIACGENNKSVIVTQGNKSLSFQCDAVFGENAKQTDVYEQLGKNLLSQFMDGCNVCVFAYGQTGSGKTHSIIGNENDPGVLPRFCRDLFTCAVDGLKKQEVTIEASFFELYLEKAYDLLMEPRTQLRIRGADSAYLEGLTSVKVSRYDEMVSILEAGVAKRATTATLVNEFSSRSHAIFQIVFRRNLSEVVNGVERKSVVTSNCYFVDLAGSERLDMVGNSNRAETANINCSLLALQKVIDAKSAPISTFVNYRESVLTRLLKECFGGNSVTSLLATVSPELQYTGVSIGTLRFASKAALVRQTPKTNIDPFVSAVQDLKAENDEMRVELEKWRSSARTPTKGRSSIYRRCEPPCLVELCKDNLLNVWFKVTGDDLIVTTPTDETHSFICFNRGKETILRAQNEDVVVNGRPLPQYDEISLNHGDRIALGGVRFFSFRAHDDATALPSFDSAKLEYVQSTFESLRQKLQEEARLAYEQDRDEIIRQMNEELEKTKKELELVKTSMAKDKDVNQIDLTEQKFELENCAEETQEFREKLESVDSEADDLFVALQDLCNAEKTELIELETKVSTVNNILDCFKKHGFFKFKLVQNAPSEVERVCIRLLNVKAHTFADLTYEQFERVYDSIVQIYHNSTVIPDGIRDVEEILYGGNWQWKRSVAGRRSNIFSAALYNSMCDVARSRRSSVAQLQRTFTSRQTALGEVIEQAMNAKKQASQSIFDTHMSLWAVHEEDNAPDTKPRSLIHNLIKWTCDVSECLRDADYQIECCRKDNDLRRTGIASPDQTAIYAVAKFMKAVGILEAVIQCINHTMDPLDVVVSEMLDIVSVITKDRDRWVHAVNSKSESSNFFLKAFNRHLNMMFVLIGRYAFVVGDRFPQDELPTTSTSDLPTATAQLAKSNSTSSLSTALKAREMFDRGVLFAIDEACTKISEIREFYEMSGYCELSPAVLMLCDCIEMIHLAVKAECNLDDRIVFDVLRCLIFVRNKLMLPNVELNDAGAMLLELKSTMDALVGSLSASLADAVKTVSASIQSAVSVLQKARDMPTSPPSHGTPWSSKAIRRGILTPRIENNGSAYDAVDNSLEGLSVIDIFAARRLDD